VGIIIAITTDAPITMGSTGPTTGVTITATGATVIERVCVIMTGAAATSVLTAMTGVRTLEHEDALTVGITGNR
jgi:hypothetical protein